MIDEHSTLFLLHHIKSTWPSFLSVIDSPRGHVDKAIPNRLYYVSRMKNKFYLRLVIVNLCKIHFFPTTRIRAVRETYIQIGMA